MKYKVTIETGNLRGAGTDACVSIKLTGKNGTETDDVSLNKWFHNDFEKGEVDTYDVSGDDVGEVVMVTLNNNGMGVKSDWYIAKIIVEKDEIGNDDKFIFPCYRWVIHRLVVYEGKAILPNSPDNVDVLRKQRQKEVDENRKVYKWGDDSNYTHDLPGFIKAKDDKDLPKDVRFTDEATLSLFRVGLVDFNNLGLSQIYDLWDSWDSLSDFRHLITPAIESGLPHAAEYWRDDVWFGSQFLNGSNPEVIKRCDKLPENFPVKNVDVKNLLDRGYTLEKAIKEELIFIADYKILEGIATMDTPTDKRYIVPAIGLFYLKQNDDLIPIAIQLGQQPNSETPIWTPQIDTEWDWIMAKLWLRCADTQYHQMISHLLRCHLMMEPFAVASWRNLPSLHPVWKLLYPHTKGTMAINTLGRSDLIPDGGAADKVLSIGGGGQVELMQKYYRAVTFDSYDIPTELNKRGVDGLNKFYYKNDALELWKAIHQFVKDIIYIYYKDDETVQQDNEIQDWIRDLHDNGYKPGADNVDKNVPKSFTDRNKLIHFLTIVVFTCSCQHAAVNFSQMATYGFHPNSPSLMRQPHPTKKQTVDENKIISTLANKHQAGTMISIVNALTTVYPNEVFLGDYVDNLFSDALAFAALASFKNKLETITVTIKKRNERLIAPYEWLLPGRVPNSISI